MEVNVPELLLGNCRQSLEAMEWLERLPSAVHELQVEWSLKVGEPFEAQAAWVAPAALGDGTRAVLKLGMPHLEGRDESEGLRFWDGEPTVHLLASDLGHNAMLLERCDPGSTLRDLPEPEQDVVIAGLLRRLWRAPPKSLPFRPLTTMLEHWAAETLDGIDQCEIATTSLDS